MAHMGPDMLLLRQVINESQPFFKALKLWLLVMKNSNWYAQSNSELRHLFLVLLQLLFFKKVVETSNIASNLIRLSVETHKHYLSCGI